MRGHNLYKYFTKEDVHAMTVANHLKFHYGRLMWWHTPNEGKRTPIEQLKVRDLGIRSGVSDILVISDLIGEKGLCLELKSESGRVTPLQKAFQEQMEACGWTVAVSFKQEDSIALLDKWILEHCSAAVVTQKNINLRKR